MNERYLSFCSPLTLPSLHVPVLTFFRSDGYVGDPHPLQSRTDSESIRASVRHVESRMHDVRDAYWRGGFSFVSYLSSDTPLSYFSYFFNFFYFTFGFIRRRTLKSAYFF